MTHDEAMGSPLGRHLLRYCYCGPSALPSVDNEGRAGTVPMSDTCRIHYALAGIDPVLKETALQVGELVKALESVRGTLSICMTPGVAIAKASVYGAIDVIDEALNEKRTEKQKRAHQGPAELLCEREEGHEGPRMGDCSKAYPNQE